MKRKFVLIVLIIALAAFAAACAARSGSERAFRTASGKRVTLYVLIDRGIEKSFSNYEVMNYNHVGEWMEKDLPAVLAKVGCKARLISSRSEFRPADGMYLLTVKIAKYRPGSRAARMVIGFGAGAASMDTHFELYGQGARPLVTGDPSVGTGRFSWKRVVRKIDEITAKDVSKALAD